MRTIDGALLGLMALLIAFGFSLAATKFESRRQTIIDEANLLSTAILRCNLYSDSVKQFLWPSYKNYLEARIGYYEAGDDPVKIKAELDNADKHFRSMWNTYNPDK